MNSSKPSNKTAPPNPIDEIIKEAIETRNKGEYQKAIDLVIPLLQHPHKKKLVVRQELDVLNLLVYVHRVLLKHKIALSYAEKYLELTQRSFKFESLERAIALRILSMVNRDLENLTPANDNITKALNIMKKLKLDQSQEYESMLMVFASIKYKKGQFKKALKIYTKVSVLASRNVQAREYSILLNEIALCHQKLQQWDKAIDCYKRQIGHGLKLNANDHIDHATALWNFGNLYFDLGQFNDALQLLEEGRVIYRKICGDQNEITIYKTKRIIELRESIKSLDREPTLLHNFRMCHNCEKIKEDMEHCTGCYKAWYCNKECQLEDWPGHKSECHVCMRCDTLLSKGDEDILKCDKCKKAKYCSLDCQTAHLDEHLEVCM